ncbi:MAG TPA: alpha-hydroxy acid oxidase [Burkholderiales bacterium]|nr:alpha-hydroxy acid oxidase [Burkholderiales bacterium]
MSTPQFLTMHELVKKARQNLNHNNWDYIVGGTETETTLRRNRHALDALAFRPRVLCDVGNVDPSTTFLGQKSRLPVFLAPVGGLEHFAPEGAVTAARAAHEFGVIQMLSSVCEPGTEPVAKNVPDGMRSFQLYVHGDPAWVDDILAHALSLGYTSLCLTVDTAYYSRRERDLAQRNIRRANVPGREHQAVLNWKDIERIRTKFKAPLMLKGIATAEDAKLAMEHGVDVVYVSNHGGRQLDHGLGTMDILPEVVEAVAGKARIVIDGSFNRGTDVIKAIAAGADMVGIGRMQCVGLAADGQAGLVRMLEILETEILSCMGLLGVQRLSELNRSYLRAAPVVTDPRAFSSFPLLTFEEKSFY